MAKHSMYQLLNENGKVMERSLVAEIPEEDIKRLYQLMVLTRIFDETALSLQREGRMLTYAPVRGQEAQVAAAYALLEGDWLVPAFRENGAMLARGVSLEMLYQYWAGDERGSQMLEGINVLPVAIPVGSQVLHAVGLAWASQLQGKKNVALVFFGDGATSKGDFHEAMNFAGVFKVPCVFVCQNNQWAISMPRKRQTASQTIAQKARAYGFEGKLVDGNDALAVYQAVREAAERARTGGGPTLIEMYTYRMGSHTTSDDPGRYRPKREEEAWQKKDPLIRLKRFMLAQGIWTEGEDEKLSQAARQEVNEAVKKEEAVPTADPKDMFRFIFARMTKNLKEQMDSLGG